MKRTLIMSVVTLVSGVALAIPDAPADYLAKKNPVDGNKEAIAKGAKLYEKRCQKCHGEKGDGQGKSAKDLNPEVTAFNKPGYLKGRKDGQLYWIIEQGSPKTDMDSFGPGTNYNHSADDIWAMIAYMRSKFTK
ncbi:MAG: hypothetical protein BroJett040_20290 [Oligoflexia bacterium]|nr:MAG: hypothetical protein BroJett040_20290 [Oligoflexia bacterium]